jgi:hypothetical protein
MSPEDRHVTNTFYRNRNDVAVQAAIAEHCGVLGVMEVPEGADPTGYRLCAEHPASPNIHSANPAVAVRDGLAPVRAAALCTDQKGNFCSSKNWCWKSCGNGWGPGKKDYYQWCWLASNHGSGEYWKCTDHVQCEDSVGNGWAGCATGCLGSCGCNCG